MLTGYIRKEGRGRERWSIRWVDKSLPGPRPGSSSESRYLSLGSENVDSWDEGADRIEQCTGRRPTRRGYVRTHARGPVPTGNRERVLAQTRTPGRKSNDRVVRAVLERSKGKSEYSGKKVGWFKKNGEPGLTVHHVWDNLEGTEVCLAILFEEHARLNYGTDGDMVNEEMKDILCEKFGLDKDEMNARNEEAGLMSEQAA